MEVKIAGKFIYFGHLYHGYVSHNQRVWCPWPHDDWALEVSQEQLRMSEEKAMEDLTVQEGDLYGHRAMVVFFSNFMAINKVMDILKNISNNYHSLMYFSAQFCGIWWFDFQLVSLPYGWWFATTMQRKKPLQFCGVRNAPLSKNILWNIGKPKKPLKAIGIPWSEMIIFMIRSDQNDEIGIKLNFLLKILYLRCHQSLSAFVAMCSMCSVHSAVSGEVLAVVEDYEGKTAREMKRILAAKLGITRFRQRIMLDNSELQDDTTLGEMAKVQLLLLEFCEPDMEEDKRTDSCLSCSIIIVLNPDVLFRSCCFKFQF